MLALDLAAFRATALTQEPFPYLIVPGFVRAEACSGIHADFPKIDRPGSFPAGSLSYGPAFRSLLATLDGPEVRAAYRRLLEQGWTDALRTMRPSERIYTFWKYFRNAFARNAGLRIDHLLLSPALAGRLVAAGVDRDVRAREKSSDRAPVWLELADAGAGPRHTRETRPGYPRR